PGRPLHAAGVVAHGLLRARARGRPPPRLGRGDGGAPRRRADEPGGARELHARVRGRRAAPGRAARGRRRQGRPRTDRRPPRPLLEAGGESSEAAIMSSASKHFDPVLGIDVHLILVLQAPVPIPNPFVGILFDPVDYLPRLGATVWVNDVPRAQAGSSGMTVV